MDDEQLVEARDLEDTENGALGADDGERAEEWPKRYPPFGIEIDLPARGARHQRPENTQHHHADGQQLCVAEYLAKLFERNLLQQVVDGQRTDGEAGGDLQKSGYGCTS